jgi:hypothetical protein
LKDAPPEPPAANTVTVETPAGTIQLSAAPVSAKLTMQVPAEHDGVGGGNAAA